NHTAGIRNYTDLGARWLDQADVSVTPQSLVRLFRDEPFDFAPGEKFAYSNSGYYLLRLVIEKVSGRTYADYVRETLVAPAGMHASAYCDTSSVGRARGYDVVDGTTVPARP